MSNEEIRQVVMEHQIEIQKILESCCNTFELNSDIMAHKNAINALREQCTHLNSNHEIQAFNGYCIYCGKLMG